MNNSLTQNSNSSYNLHIYNKTNKLLFRKTMATRYKQMGMSIEEIAKILGHKSIKTTEQFYLSIMDNDIRHIVQKCS